LYFVAVGQHQARGRANKWTFALAGGLLAGTLDITYAWVFWALKAGATPVRIFQSVARGLLGPAAFQGGAATAARGLFLHYFIATSMSFGFFLVAQRWTALRSRPLPYGAGYGLLLYVIMNYIVVPLSAARGGGSGGALWVTLSILVHMFLIGVPIASFTSRAFSGLSTERLAVSASRPEA